jgi:peptidoglycan DL-endopeptidase CwlO
VLTGRKSRAVRLTVAASAAVVVAGLVSPAASADPDPSIAEVSDRVDQLQHEAEQAIERYNTINEQVADARDALSGVRTDVRSQRKETEELRGQVEQLVLAQAESTGGVDTAARLLGADDPDAFVASMLAMESYSDQTADLLTSYESSKAQLALRQQQAQDQLAQIQEAEAQAAEDKAEALDKAEAAEELLAELEEERAARLAAQEASATSRSTTTRVPTYPPVAASGNAGTAVATALAQVGDPYSYGAAGPDAFDCSGLTMFAWRAAGVSLPHSSSMQAGMGVPVSTSAMQPGDLVFYYSPISHVGMYIGNGQIVHAPNSGSVVQVVGVNMMPLAAVRRVG